jgi:mRNA interferase YafQ
VLKLKTTHKFDKDLVKAIKGGKDLEKIQTIMNQLVRQEGLDRKHKDHKLKGVLKNRRECHIEPDWLLIYKIESNTIIFERTGSHSELF